MITCWQIKKSMIINTNALAMNGCLAVLKLSKNHYILDYLPRNSLLFLLLGIAPLFFRRLTASRKCFGCNGPLSSHCSIIPIAERIYFPSTYNTNPNSHDYTLDNYVITFFNNFTHKHFGNSRHGDDNILWHWTAGDGLHQLVKKRKELHLVNMRGQGKSKCLSPVHWHGPT